MPHNDWVPALVFSSHQISRNSLLINHKYLYLQKGNSIFK